LFWTTLRGFLGNFREGKMTPDGKYGKNYLLTIYVVIKTNKFVLVKYFHKCRDWDIASLAKISKFGKGGGRGQSCHFQIVVDFEWRIRWTI
jgi:hypothetical protein